MTVAELLTAAGTSLDEKAHNANYFGDQVQPYNRLTGVSLSVDLDLTNYADMTGQHEHESWDQTHNVACKMTVSHRGSWTSLGSKVTGYEDAHRVSGRSPATEYTTGKVYDRYQQGVKVVYSAHGKIGVFSLTHAVNTFVQALVLLGLSTTVCKIVANYLLVWDGTSRIFNKYQNIVCDKQKALARTAASTAMQLNTFFDALDPDFENEMSKARLFQNLRAVLGAPHGDEDDEYEGLSLNNEQIAQIVTDVVRMANGKIQDVHDPVNIDEFCDLTSDDTCDLVSVMQHYHSLPGDPDMLETIMAEPVMQDDYPHRPKWEGLTRIVNLRQSLAQHAFAQDSDEETGAPSSGTENKGPDVEMSPVGTDNPLVQASALAVENTDNAGKD